MKDWTKNLDPVLVKKACAVIADLRSHGYTLTVVQGWRSRATQLALWAIGRTPVWNPRIQVTWTKTSRHMSGRAVDFAFVDKRGRPSWDKSYPWDLIGKSAAVHGLKWGVFVTKTDGLKRRTDFGHVELP